MALLSQSSISAQMLAQLRLLDPSASAEVGTPERKILDTVAQSLYDSQVDLSTLQGALDVDSKYGSALDRLLALFGFARQKATYANGYVTFSRVTPSTSDIRIPASTICYAPTQASTDQGAETLSVQVLTLYDASLPAGSLSVTVPVRSQIAGSLGNLAGGRVTTVSGSVSYGITGVTNELPLKNGIDAETDNEYKIRFKNTVFRNLAGTEDQYLALAVSTASTTKANVIGPVSLYREYIQVPPFDDATSYDVNDSGPQETGNGSAGKYTTALSSLPFAKQIYDHQFPAFVTSGEPTQNSIFYRPDIDFDFNIVDSNRNRGDAYRFGIAGLDSPIGSALAKNRPNFTFKNIYNGTNANVVAVRPNDIVLSEYSYLSSASRNNIVLGITNAVDVYIDGENLAQGSTMIIRPTSATAFDNVPTSKFFSENYRRIGKPTKRPEINNVLTTMYWQPVTNLPDFIVVGTDTYYKDINYWAVEDVSILGGTIRSRGGIEWSSSRHAKAATDSFDNFSTWTGRIITVSTGDPLGGAPIEILSYAYDRNIPDLQATFEGSKQVTTDVLTHRAKTRWFKIDLSVMYDSGVSKVDTNLLVQAAVDSFLKSQYFGSSIQLSDILQIVHGVSGIDNVRWSTDIPNGADLERVYETDQDGNTLTEVSIDRILNGTMSTHETQRIYVNGNPKSGSYTLSLGPDVGSISATVTHTAEGGSDFTAFLTTIAAGGYSATITKVLSSDNTDPYVAYDIQFVSFAPMTLISTSNVNLSGGAFVFNHDWILKDNELARLSEAAQGSDTLPGLIIRPRAANTWIRGR